VLCVPYVIDAVEIHHLKIFIGEEREGCAAFFFEPRGRDHVLRIDYPDRRACLQFLRVFDQLDELAITPRSPFAPHKKEDDGFARAQFFHQRMWLIAFVG